MKRNRIENRNGMSVAGTGFRNRLALPKLRTFTSLGSSSYRLYFIGMTGQWAAMNMHMMTNSLLVYRLTGSAAILGVLSLANGLPVLLISPYGGVIADRLQKKHILIAGLAASAAVCFILGFLLTAGYMSAERSGSWLILVASSLLLGVIMGLMMPARQAIIPEIVGVRQVTNAVALNNLGMNALRLVAPAVAGFLIDAFDFEAVYYSMGALYLFGAVFISFIPATSSMAARATSAMVNLRQGFNYIRSHTIILLILVITLIGVVQSQPYMRLLPIFTDDILKVGATGLGVLLSVSGAGAIAGSLVLASLPDRKRGLMLLISSIILGLALAAFSFSQSWHLALIIIVVVGLAQSVRMTLGNALLQTYVEDEYRGRIMSFYMMEMGLTSISAFFAGLMAEAIGVQWAVGGFAISLALMCIVALMVAGRMRRLD